MDESLKDQYIVQISKISNEDQRYRLAEDIEEDENLTDEEKQELTDLLMDKEV